MMELRELSCPELPMAAQMLARGMCDDPMHRTVFGPSSIRRLERLRRFFTSLLPRMGKAPLSAWDDGRLVGVLSQFPPGRCCPPFGQQLRIALPLLTFHLSELWRLWRWTHVSEAHDIEEPHWHLGPVGVDVDRQRQGIGSLLLQAFCERMDKQRAVAFLETDKLDSVRFYARCHFEVVAEGKVLGTRNWWMRRQAR